MKLFKTVSLLFAILQTPAITFARDCDDRDHQPPPECRYNGNGLNFLKSQFDFSGTGKLIGTLGLPPQCSPENKKQVCQIDCTVYDSSNRPYLDIQCLDICMDEPCR
jgi:hypothetical protein